jgi:hypothetical protein
MKFRTLAAAACASAALFAPLQAAAQARPIAAASNDWTFSVMPYLWLPNVDGQLRYGPPRLGGGSPNVEVDAGNLLDNLEFAAMVSGQARKGRWLIATDIIYLDFDKQDSSVKSVNLNPGSGRVNVATSSLNTGTQSTLKGWLWTAVGGYGVVMDPGWNLDVIGGFRLLSIDADSTWNLTTTVTGTGPNGDTATFARTGTASSSENIWTAIVGAKGRYRFGASDWFANYYVDLGGNSDTFTWQGSAGVGYAFKWGEVVLDYRYLYYNQSGDKLIDSVTFAGFGLGVNFRF